MTVKVSSHVIPCLKSKIGKNVKRVVIDHIHFWNPRTKNQPVKESEVEDYVINLHNKFKFKQVSIDQWNSQSSLIKLQSRR